MSTSDAREALRRYLEQRRELGESELRLDSLDVDDVMRMVGALAPGSPSKARAPEPAPAPAMGSATAPRAQPAGDPSAATPELRDRDAMRAPSTAPPNTADWREALRATGAAPGGRGAEPPAKGVASAPAGSASGPAENKAAGDDEAAAKRGAEEAMAAKRRSAAADPDAATPASAPRGRKMDFDEAGAARPAPPLADIPTGLVVGGEGGEFLRGPLSKLRTLDQIAEMTRSCTRCGLYKTAKQAVPGEGNPNADFVCVGEAPGEKEDESGKPFVGQSGQLLTKILAAINLTREDVFICNVIKHRPPGNRNPLPDEVLACSPYLLRQLELVKPKVIVAFGTFAAQTLLDTKLALGKLRGTIHQYHGIPLVVTYHPAALLRNPTWKRPTWEDVQLARRLLDRPGGT